MRRFQFESLGGGAGLRHQHLSQIILKRPSFNWFEIITEDFIDCSGYVRESFEEICRSYRIIPHGVGLSIGSTDPLDLVFLKRLAKFLDKLNAPWYSDHLCFTAVDHSNLEDLIPLPFTKEAVKHIVERVKVVQGILKRPLLLENVTRYVTVSDRELSESDFISEILEQADCGLLLDLANVYLNSKFHGYDKDQFLRELPLERVGQIHLAGWDDEDGQVIDSHDAPVPPEVWEFYKSALPLVGPTSVLIEWDKSLPTVERLLQEAQMADKLMREICPERSAVENSNVGAIVGL